MTSADESPDRVRQYLSCVNPFVIEIPDPFDFDLVSQGSIRGVGIPARLRGQFAKIAEDVRHVAHEYLRKRAALKSKAISAGTASTTIFTSNDLELVSELEKELSALLETWYCSLSSDDKSRVDAYCLTIVPSRLQAQLQDQFPMSLHGAVARGTLQYAALARRFESEQSKFHEYLISHGLSNRTILSSVQTGIMRRRDIAIERLIGQWFRELSPEQSAEFDGSDERRLPKRANEAVPDVDLDSGQGNVHTEIKEVLPAPSEAMEKSRNEAQPKHSRLTELDQSILISLLEGKALDPNDSLSAARIAKAV